MYVTMYKFFLFANREKCNLQRAWCDLDSTWSSRACPGPCPYQGSSVSGLWPEVDRLRVARLSVVQRSVAGGSWHFGTTLAQAHAESVPSGGHQHQ